MTREFLFKPGDQFSWERHISAEEVRKFGELVGDLNPVHIDAEYAGRSYFKGRIVHGAFLAGLLSKVLGMDFPGEGTIYISQNTIFKRPVYVDTTVVVEVAINQVLVEERRLVLDTRILNSDGKVCVAGLATVWIPE